VNDMSTAPGDKPILLHMPDGTSFRGEIDLFPDEDGNDVGGWVCLEEGKEPNDGCDGVCWTSNSNGVASTRPAGWTHLKEQS